MGARRRSATRVTRSAAAEATAAMRRGVGGDDDDDGETVTATRDDDDEDEDDGDDDDDDDDESGANSDDDDDDDDDDTGARDSGAAATTSARRDCRAEKTRTKSVGGGKRATHLPDDDDIAFAYANLDVKKRGFFTARDIRRVADANGFADWTDDDVRRMSAAFKPKRVRDAMSADDPTMFKLTRDEFIDVVRRSGARVGE